MAEEQEFTIRIEHMRDLAFKVQFDWPETPPLLTDEPEPMGQRKGPNSTRLVAAAVGNCLSASLLFCLTKSRVPVGGVTSLVKARVERNEKGRLRLAGLQVRIQVAGVAGDDAAKLERCLKLYEDFCVVTASLRQGLPVDVEVVDESGRLLSRE
jgi:uncharacterized OsmC-like protein